MIILTDAARQMFRSPCFSGNAKQFRIEYSKAACPCARGFLTLTAGKPLKTDLTYISDGYSFAIDPELIKQAQDIVIDASGQIPVLSSRKPLYL